MRSNEYLWKICMEIYRQQYKEAEPSADFDKLIESGETRKPNWFMEYYLPQDRQQEIFDEIVKKYKCDKYEKRAISHEVWLGCSPTGFRKEEK